MDSAITEVAREEYKRISEELILIVMPRITNINIGMNLWEGFEMKVKENPNLAELNQAYNVIDARINELRCTPKDDTSPLA